MAESPPIIDISPLRAGADDPRCRDRVGSIDRACVETGFFVATGHGIDASISRVFEAARRFFSLPQHEKEALSRSDRYGYIPHSSVAIDTSRASDRTEYIDIGMHAEGPLPDIDGFAAAVDAYQHDALLVARDILRALAIALELDPGFFAARMTDPQCRLRFLHYFVADIGPDRVRPVPNTPHTDYGLITLLATDGVPGLEIKPIGEQWAPVATAAGELVVNLGDMLARWTNHRYVSTPHRVVGSPDRERISVPFFVNPDPATEVSCIPSCVSEESPCRYGPITAGEFLAARIDGTDEPYVDPSEGPVRLIEP